MDNKQFWALVAEEERKLKAWQTNRQAAVSRGEKDADSHQPIDQPFAWAVTLKLQDGQQLGGAITPLAFHVLAKNLIGPNGHQTHRLCTASEMEQFWQDEARRRGEIQHARDREENKVRTLVSTVPPAPRGKAV